MAENKTGVSKILILGKVDVNLKILKFFFRMAHTAKALPEYRYIESEKRILEIGRMLGGWIKEIKKH